MSERGKQLGRALSFAMSGGQLTGVQVADIADYYGGLQAENEKLKADLKDEQERGQG